MVVQFVKKKAGQPLTGSFFRPLGPSLMYRLHKWLNFCQKKLNQSIRSLLFCQNFSLTERRTRLSDSIVSRGWANTLSCALSIGLFLAPYQEKANGRNYFERWCSNCFMDKFFKFVAVKTINFVPMQSILFPRTHLFPVCALDFCKAARIVL